MTRTLGMLGCCVVAAACLLATVAFYVYGFYLLGSDRDWFGWAQAVLAATGCFGIYRTFKPVAERIYPELIV